MPILDFIGKPDVLNHHNHVPVRLLREESQFSLPSGNEPAENLIVEGDNLEALRALLPRYGGQVKCIYIDPPYNTGNEGWAYNDNVNAPVIKQWLAKTVGRDDLSRHDKWLCMMLPRLRLLREFLRPDGAIFISIDDNEVHHLRCLLDEVFGEQNFVAEIMWQKRTSPDARKNLAAAHDYILAYAHTQPSLRLNLIHLSEERTSSYKNPDKDPRGNWASVDLTGQTGHATASQFYEIKAPTGVIYKPPEGRCWAIAESTFLALIADNRIWFGKDGTSRPRLKKFLNETEGTTAWTWWTHLEVGHTQEATKDLNEIMGQADSFTTTPKPTRLIARILQIASDPDSIILDSFAGSGTTGQAVLELNKADGGRRQFVLVEMEPEIARSITAERVRRVAAGYTDAKGRQVEGTGGGFRFMRLGEALFDENGEITPSVRFGELARYVFFYETGEPLQESAMQANTPLLGIVSAQAVALLYNGILKDKSAQGGNALTRETLAIIKASIDESAADFAGTVVVYGTSCRLSDERLREAGVVFKQIPYRLHIANTD
jgi:site-specific DNA-methyltransferase (adenine-specific)/adenine-specific DNA-methyltransferase